jgi:hypothetical protein
MLPRSAHSNIKASIPLTGGLNVFEPTETSWVAIIVPQSEDEWYVLGVLQMTRPLYVPNLGRDKRKDSILGSGCAALVNFVSQACQRAQLLKRAKKILFDFDFAFCHLPFSNYTHRYGSGIRP